MTEADFQTNNRNQLQVANFGRKSNLELERNDKKIALKDWAGEILTSMEAVCSILDQDDASKPYSMALLAQQQVVQNPDLTASARMLAIMTETEQPFSRFALNKSVEHAACFKGHKPDDAFTTQFNALAQQSIAKQTELENKPQLPFDEFLNNYFTQKCENDG
jgi:glutamate--cysteine ligase